MMNEDLMKAAGYDKEVSLVKLGKCPFCHIETSENDFKDELSKREYKISGLCQKCQDSVFG